MPLPHYYGSMSVVGRGARWRLLPDHVAGLCESGDLMETRGTRRVAVVTGASSGIGKEVARALAARGWRVIGLGRDAARTSTAVAEIRAASAGGQVDMIRADLSLLADAERAAREIAALTDRIDVLVNNAGGMSRQREV